MKELSEPVEVCLQRLDMIYVREYAQVSGASVAATVRDLVHEAIVARDRKNRPEDDTPVLSLPGLPQGTQGAKGDSSERIGPRGKTAARIRRVSKTARVPDTPLTPPKYEITHVSGTTEEEI